MSRRAFVKETNGVWQVKVLNTKTGEVKLQDVFNNKEEAIVKAKLSNYIYKKCEVFCRDYQKTHN